MECGRLSEENLLLRADLADVKRSLGGYGEVIGSFADVYKTTKGHRDACFRKITKFKKVCSKFYGNLITQREASIGVSGDEGEVGDFPRRASAVGYPRGARKGPGRPQAAGDEEELRDLGEDKQVWAHLRKKEGQKEGFLG